MTQHSFLPFADFFQGIIPGVERMGYEPCFKQIYQPIFMKGVKKIQSSENFFETQAPLYSQTAFKKIHSVDNFIPEDLDFDLNPLFVRDGANARITYDEVQKAKLQQASKKKSAGEADFRIKYKTEVCKYWAAYGYCEFGDQCAFAHGKQEIREKVHISTNYKTKKCVQYHENLYCPYGQRCQFLHSSRMQPREKGSEDRFSYVKEMENPELWFSHKPDCVCCIKRSRPRLPIFAAITEEIGGRREQPQQRNCQCAASADDELEREMGALIDYGSSAN